MKTIRIISPSGVIDPLYIDQAAARLRSWGFDVSEGQYARCQAGRFAGTDEQRIADIVQAFNDQPDFILCSRGGYGLQRILSDLQSPISNLRSAISNIQSPIPTLIGFSDITALHQLCGLQGWQSIHGLMCKHIATLPEDSEPLRAFRRLLEGDSLSYPLPQHPLNRNGNVSGYLCGGNLSVLYGLQGTPYSLQALMDTRAAQPILFIEDIAERHYHIDRMMNNLKMSGVLARLGGLIVGQFSDCEDDPSMGGTVYDTIRHAVDEYDYPVYFNFPAGHVDNHFPLVFGQAAVQNNQLSLSPLVN